jgi:hypothetical protein
MKVALGIRGGDLKIQAYRTTTVSSQLVHSVLSHIIIDLLNNLVGNIVKKL